MNTIDAFENDIVLQLDFLGKFRPQKKQAKNAIFCGSGDSLCAAMLAESFSDYSVRACDPLEFAKNQRLGNKKHAYFVSVTGNTIANIAAAQLAKNSTAITKNPNSKLAKICSNAIVLDYLDSGVLTAGSIGFLANALTCISMVYSFRINNAKKLFQFAKSQSKIKLHGRIYFLGNQYTYPIAMYASAKLGEVLGLDSHYERIEQFSHMGLFSAKRGDTVVILEQKNKHNSALCNNLKKLGLHVYAPTIQSKNKIAQVLFYTFISQFLALNLAKQKRIKDCYFITRKKIRDASSDMIY